MIPILSNPQGDPAGLRIAVRQLSAAAESLAQVSNQLSDSNQQASQTWEGGARQVFALLTEGIVATIGSSAGMTIAFFPALTRYADCLEACQNQVTVCRQRLDQVAAATPPGMYPDQVLVNSILAQANDAYAEVAAAARELSATALSLMGADSTGGAGFVANGANATFVSQAHAGDLAGSHPRSAAFDVQAAQVQAQMRSVLSSLTSWVSAPMSVAAAAVVGGSDSGSFSGPVLSGAVVGGNAPSFVGVSGILSGSTVGGSTGPSSSTGFFTGSAAVGGNAIISNNFDIPGLPSVVTVSNPTAPSTMMNIVNMGEAARKNSVATMWSQMYPGVPIPDFPTDQLLALLNQAPNPTLIGSQIITGMGQSFALQNELILAPGGYEITTT